MTANYVTLILDLADGSGSPVTKGTATLSPSVQLTDSADGMDVVAPVTASFRQGSYPQVRLLATDNTGPQPAGWAWTVSFSGVPGNPASFSFFLPNSGGATQHLSALSPVSSAVTMQAYMPLPSGTPSSGQVPVATGAGEASAWGTISSGVTSVFGRTGAVTAQSGDYTPAQVGADAAGAAAAVQALAALKANNLSDLASAPAARTNLGLGSAATQPSTAFDAAGVAATAAKPYGLAIGKGLCVVPVGTRSHAQFDTTLSASSSASQTYRQFHPLSDPACGEILPVFMNINYLGGIGSAVGDGNAANPVTVACAVECSDGTVRPFTFNGGNHTVTIPVNDGFLAIPDNPIAFGSQVTNTANNGIGTVSGVYLRVYVSIPASRQDSVTTTINSPTVSDASITTADLGVPVSGTGIPANCVVGSPLVAGTSFTLVQNTAWNVQTAVNATASGTVTATLNPQLQLNFGTTLCNSDVTNGPNGADATPSSSGIWSGGTNAAYYGPAVLLGRAPAVRKPIVAQITDSIFNGTTDAFIGPVERGCIANGFPFVKLSKFGEYAQAWSKPGPVRYRLMLTPGCTHAIVELGTNDGIQTAGKVTSLEGYLTTLGQYLTALGIQAWLATICPRTTSTDSWATLANQTPTYPAAQISTFNTWVRGVPSPYAGYIELGNLVSSAPDSGLWAVNGTANYATSDGTHPSNAFMTSTIASAVQTVMSAWTVS